MTDVASADLPDQIASEFDADDYAAFIAQIELDGLWLVSSRIANHVGLRQPIRAEVGVESRANWTPRPSGFEIEHAYRVSVEGERAPALEIEVVFGLAFSSPLPMTPALFQAFEEVNLPVNTWPYLREYVASAFGRVGWVPFTLPTLKRGVAPRADEPMPPVPKPKPRRKRRASVSET